MWFCCSVNFMFNSVEPLIASNESRALQEVVDQAVRRCLSCASGVVPSGRTDRGVHAKEMLAFCNVKAKDFNDKQVEEVVRQLPLALNACLPRDVRCRAAWWTSDLSFCPRGLARKTYVFYLSQLLDTKDTVDTVECQEALKALQLGSWLQETPLEISLKAMGSQAALLVGRHDFLLLSSAREAQDTVRELLDLQVDEPSHVSLDLLGHCFEGGAVVLKEDCPRCQQRCQQPKRPGRPLVRLLRVRATATGFLKHMVRRIVGLLLEAQVKMRDFYLRLYEFR